MLKKAILEHALHTGKRCVSLDQKDSTVQVTFEDGSTIYANVVIGADGIHSVVRYKFYADRPIIPVEIAYRTLVDVADLEGIVNLDDINEGILWCGPERRILTYPISTNGRILNIVRFFPPASNDDYVESYRVDYSLVRYVVHCGAPYDIVSYAQENGRAGRNGKRADCISDRDL